MSLEFSPQSGSLNHSPVTGKSVSSPSRASFSQSELVKEAFSDPSFLQQVRGLEAMLRVRERAVAHPDAGRAAFETDSIDSLSESSGAGCDEVAPRSVAGVRVLTLWLLCAASVGHGVATNKRDLEMGIGTETDAERVLVAPESIWCSMR